MTHLPQVGTWLRPQKGKAALRIFKTGLAIALLLLLALTCVVHGQNNQQDQDQKDLIAQLLVQLGGDSFAARQNAMRDLGQMGPNVLPALRQAITSGNPELRLRSIAVIGFLAVSDQPDSQREAQKVLAELSASDNPGVRALAKRTIAQMGGKMSGQAIETLSSLGARIDSNQVYDGARTRTSYVVTIDESFKGLADDLGLLSWLDGPTSLTLIGEVFDDAAIARFSGIPELVTLVIKRGRISDVSIRTISQFKSLKHLQLYYVDITDDSVDLIVKMNYLATLRLFGTKVSQRKGEWAKTVMHATDVDWRNGAFLGIYFTDTDGPCTVNNVVEGSAADTSGFQQNDKIIKFGKTPINTGREFLRLVAKRFPGDSLVATVKRGDEEFEIKFVLGRFPDSETFKN